MNKMIVANLVQRPIRSLISIVAIALEVTLILMIVWLSLGMMNDSRNRQEGIGADVIVLPPGSSNIIGMTGAPAPIKVADVLAKLDHVTMVSPVLMQLSSGTGGAPEVLYGIDLKSYESLGGPFRYLRGGPYQGPDDVLVDDIYAQSKHTKVGDTIQILNHSFRVAGIVEHGKGARKFLPITTLQDLIGAEGKASAFYVKLESPNDADEVVNEVKAVPGMQQYIVQSMRDYLSMMTPSSIPALAIFINVVISIAVIIGISGDLSSHVYGGHGTHARDRDIEIHWRFEVLCGECGFARDRFAGRRRYHCRNRIQPGCQCHYWIQAADAAT